MPKTLMQSVVSQLQKERARLEDELALLSRHAPKKFLFSLNWNSILEALG
jgi:hypothetical protein